MPYRVIDIQQALASAESKLSRRTYSIMLKKLYGVFDACSCSTEIQRLLLFRFALTKWDTREGATNAFDDSGLTNIIQQVNQL